MSVKKVYPDIFATLVQIIRVLTLASPTFKGGFFPNGLSGAINSWIGYNRDH